MFPSRFAPKILHMIWLDAELFFDMVLTSVKKCTIIINISKLLLSELFISAYKAYAPLGD